MAPTLSLTQLSYTTAGLLSKPIDRLDGRDLLAFRPLKIVTGVADQAAGSANCTLGDNTRCSVVISSEVVQDNSEIESGLVQSFIDVHPAIPSSANLSALLVSLQKLLDQLFNSNASAFDTSQLIILRNPKAPHKPTRAWKLIIDVTLLDVSGGNVADVVFATIYAALQDVQLPKTRAIGFDIQSMQAAQANSGQGSEKVDIFDVRGSLTRTRGAGIPSSDATRTVESDDSSFELDAEQRAKVGVDFEIKDIYDGSNPLKGTRGFPIAITINILPNGILLDATQTEEACIPYTRRILILCDALTGNVLGTQMLTASFETGSSRLGEEKTNGPIASQQAILGTCDFATIKNAIKQGQIYARALHSAIEAQIGSKIEKDTQMAIQ
ncbi:hypothetical protein L7F22_019311 [Adiantum nelumboides]|nr:hypothetical protein [Adiantum nelumboides]